MLNRRHFYRYGAIVVGNAIALALAIPGVRYLLDPLTKKGQAGGFRTLARLSQLTPGKPQAFPIIEERQDAWVKYPKEPIGSVWLIRQIGEKPSVAAFTAECPHLGCAVGLAADGKNFLCPCHTSEFGFDGKPENSVPPRGMDPLEVTLSDDPDPRVDVKFERYQTQSKERKPLV
jgi:menaquinol-cytochrome c reductase iron-sulfur subunit